MIKDYRVKITIRNERILKLIEDQGFVSVRKFCEAHKIEYQRTTELISGKLKPVKDNGELSYICSQVLEALKVELQDCFTPRQMAGFNKRSFTIKVKEQDLKKLISPTVNHEVKMIEQDAKNNIRYAIEMGLNPREAAMVKMRFGFDDGHEQTLDQISKTFSISRERVRQIISKAQRKMKHPHVMRQILKSGADEVFNIKNLPNHLKKIKKEEEKKLEYMDPEEFLDLCHAKNTNKLN
jgi:DNA-directed RNA polymerase specialized sigma subunit